jgi:hypothetical protein
VKIPPHEARIIFNKIINKPSLHNSGRLLMQGNCPLCGEKRRRFYMKDYGNDKIMVYCHNCSYSRSLYGFLKENYPQELVFLKDTFMKSIGDGSAFKKKMEKVQRAIKPYSEIDTKLRYYVKENSFGINDVQDNEKLEKFRQVTLNYFIGRKISKKLIDTLTCFYKGPLKGYAGIPFFDESGKNLIHIQGRRIFNVKNKFEEQINPKYKFLRDVDNGIEIENKPIYNMWGVDARKPVVIVEGTLDSDAFTNGVATCGATISDTFIEDVAKKYPNRIWCPDNYWQDKAGRQLTVKLLQMGETCLVFPKKCPQKDANQMVMETGIEKISDEFIDSNIYIGSMGLLKLKLMDMEMPNDIINMSKENHNEG